ncbi:MAG: signal peptide peptidase SppA [Nitrososphaerota archaeon]
MTSSKGLRRHIIPIAIILAASIVLGVVYGVLLSGRGALAFPQAPAVCTYALRGAIVSTAQPSLLTGSSFITPELVEKVLNKAKSDGCRALVLTVDSPGGEVVASHDIYRRLISFREETRKTVVIYMASVAASGGYYISLGADHIIANPGTMTGSVGAIGTLISFKRLLDDLGIDVVTVKSGEYKDVGSSLREITDMDIEFMREIVNSAFKQFESVVRESRGQKLSPQFEREIFNAKIFVGSEALKAGLVDEVGTFEDAVKRARELAGLPRDAPVRELRVATTSIFQLPISISIGDGPLSPVGMKILYIEPSHISDYLFTTGVRAWRFQSP